MSFGCLSKDNYTCIILKFDLGSLISFSQTSRHNRYLAENGGCKIWFEKSFPHLIRHKSVCSPWIPFCIVMLQNMTLLKQESNIVYGKENTANPVVVRKIFMENSEGTSQLGMLGRLNILDGNIIERAFNNEGVSKFEGEINDLVLNYSGNSDIDFIKSLFDGETLISQSTLCCSCIEAITYENIEVLHFLYQKMINKEYIGDLWPWNNGWVQVGLRSDNNLISHFIRNLGCIDGL